MKAISRIWLITLLVGSVFFVTASFVAYAQAADSRAGRLEISTDSKAPFSSVNSNGTHSEAQWLPKEEWQTHYFMFKDLSVLGKDKWQQLWIEFIPKESGTVTITLKGQYYDDLKVNRHEVLADDVKIEGKGVPPIMNAGFEEADSKGNPAGWSGFSSKNKLITDGIQAHSGKNCVLVWHDAPLTQKISVKAGEKYKLSVWFKYGK